MEVEKERYVFDGRLPWLEGRRKYIGSSDAAAIMGHGYAGESISTVWGSKVGTYEKKFSQADLDLMEDGRIAEEFVVKMFATKHKNIAVTKSQPFEIEVCKEYPFIAATLDASGLKDGKRFPIEAKLIVNQPEEWKDDECPVKYQIQLQHQMLVTGAEFGVVVAFVCGRYNERWFERDDAFLGKAVQVYETFWKHVIDRTPPPDNSPQAYEIRRAVTEWGTAKRLGVSSSQKVRDYFSMLMELKKVEKSVNSAKAAIAEIVGPVEFIILDDQRVVKMTRSGLVLQKQLPRGVRVLT